MPTRHARRTSPAGTTRPADRTPNKRAAILDAAARRFAREGFAATSMRDIAADAGLLAGSIYHHFASKEDLLAAAYAEGVGQITSAVEHAVRVRREPWSRLEAAVAAHLEELLSRTPYAALLATDLRQLEPDLLRRLAAERDRYERQFTSLVAALDLSPGTDRRLVRLMLLGALNWTPNWYRSGGASPRRIAENFVATFRYGTAR